MLKWLLRIVGVLLLVAVVVVAAFMVSPRPGAWVMKTLFDMDNASLQADLESSRRTDVTAIDDQQYRADEADALLDVYFPTNTPADKRLPTLVWTHGGAWIQGSRKFYVPFFQSYANQGFTVVALGYTLAPNRQYPTPVIQVNDALKYAVANAERFHIDTDRIFMGGDSAGSQITSQVANIITDRGYAARMNIQPAIAASQLRGIILHCGFYDLAKFAQSAEISPVRFLRFGMTAMIWAYTGSKTPAPELLDQMSAYNQATSAYPPTFISGGNGDPLTDAYSKPFAEKLKSMNVDVTTLFFAPEHEPKLGHEYQFRLNQPDAQRAFNESVTFLKKHAGG
ncbi:MAG: alpha/beta hydrolase [Pyrinomonadaceae bacterium]